MPGMPWVDGLTSGRFAFVTMSSRFCTGAFFGALAMLFSRVLSVLKGEIGAE